MEKFRESYFYGSCNLYIPNTGFLEFDQSFSQSVNSYTICRGVAQPGRALSSGGRGRKFESSLPDQL